MHGTRLRVVGNKIAPNVEQQDNGLRLQDPPRDGRYCRLLLDEKSRSSAADNAERRRDSLVQEACYSSKPQTIRSPTPRHHKVCEAQIATLGDAGHETEKCGQDGLGWNGVRALQ